MALDRLETKSIESPLLRNFRDEQLVSRLLSRSPPMSLHLDRTERRIVGCLVEKELSVPEAYPLTLNSLVAACNQKSNREPEMSLAEHEVAGALQSLMQKGWASELEMAGARTRRYAHRAREQLGVNEPDLSVLAELLLRGPQSAPEIEKRAARMRPQGSLEAVEARLDALGKRPVPYVRFLGRRPGERVPRWEHTLGSEPETTSPVPSATHAAVPPFTPAAPMAAGPSRASPAAANPLDAILARLSRLEAEVADLKRRLGD
jgi:uncharacterized protein YceH (UPF0502 family)